MLGMVKIIRNICKPQYLQEFIKDFKMFKKISKKQEGTALLMALMIMSGLVVAGFTLGSVVINELRQSRQLRSSNSCLLCS